MMNAIMQRDYYCWDCGKFALQGGLAVWCDTFESWMHIYCHDGAKRLDVRPHLECYEQQVLPASN